MLRSGPTTEEIRLAGKPTALFTRGALHELRERERDSRTKILNSFFMGVIIFKK